MRCHCIQRLFHCQGGYSTKPTRAGLRAGLAWQRLHGSARQSRDQRLAVHKQRETVSQRWRAPAAQALLAFKLPGRAAPATAQRMRQPAGSSTTRQQHHDAASSQQSETRGHSGRRGGAVAQLLTPRQWRAVARRRGASGVRCRGGAIALLTPCRGGAVPPRRNCAASRTSPAGSGLPARRQERVAGRLSGLLVWQLPGSSSGRPCAKPCRPGLYTARYSSST